MNRINIYVGAHPDDIELGCGGTLAHFSQKKYYNICVVLSNGEKGGDPNIRVKETTKALKFLGASKIVFGNFKDTEITHGFEVIKFLEDLAKANNPEFAFIPSLNEIHQDHRNSALACFLALRMGQRLNFTFIFSYLLLFINKYKNFHWSKRSDN